MGPVDAVGKFFEVLFCGVLDAFFVDVEEEDLVAFFGEVAGECSADACLVVLVRLDIRIYVYCCISASWLCLFLTLTTASNDDFGSTFNHLDLLCRVLRFREIVYNC